MEFTLTEQFNTTPEVLYKAWLDSDIYSKMTGSPADVSDKVGGEYSAWDEYITGKNLELIPFSKIKQSWRTTEFPDKQKDSIVEITFKEIKPNVTELTLKHTELADGDNEYIQGWRDFYFKPMKEYFS